MLLKLPLSPPGKLKVTVPVGVLVGAVPESVTVAVQMVLLLNGMVPGEHETSVVVLRTAALTVNVVFAIALESLLQLL
jgi:hypothetical protein